MASSRARVIGASAGAAGAASCSAAACRLPQPQRRASGRSASSGLRGCGGPGHLALLVGRRDACKAHAREFAPSPQPGADENPPCRHRRPTRATNAGARRRRDPGQPSRPGPHHRRRRRRPERHRHLLAGRRPVPLRPRLDAVPDDAADDRHPDALGAHRLRDAQRAGHQHRPDLPEVADGLADRPPGRRQHDQHRRRRGGDGRSGQAARRRAAAALRARHRRALHRDAGLLLVRADGARAQVADARALRLCRGGARGRRALAARARRIGAAVGVPADGHDRQGIRGDGRRRPRHDDQPLPVLLAGDAGSRGLPAPARSARACATTPPTCASTCGASGSTRWSAWASRTWSPCASSSPPR